MRLLLVVRIKGCITSWFGHSQWKTKWKNRQWKFVQICCFIKIASSVSFNLIIKHRGKTHCAWAQNLTSCQLFISGRAKFKSKKGETDKKEGEKFTSFESLYIFLVSNFCTTWLSGCTNGENDVWSLQVASARQDEFIFTGFLACYWFGIS